MAVQTTSFHGLEEMNNLDTKYFYVCHAELNAILNYTGSGMKGARIYTTLFPCNECTKAIIQKGIKEIIYMSDKYAHTDEVIASKRMLEAAGVNFRLYQPKGRDIILSL